MSRYSLADFVRDVPDFPKPGILFKDITPILGNGAVLDRVIQDLSEYTAGKGAEKVAGIEARGLMFGTAVASRMGLGFVPVRKAGKLPWKTVGETYALEYGEDRVEVHEDAVETGQKVVVIDDLLATGGTMGATCRLIEKLGGVVQGCACLIELSFLDGRSKIGEHDFHSLLRY